MKDVQHADGGSGSNDHDRCQIESKAEEHQHQSQAHAPQDRMTHDPVTEPARQTAHLRPHPPLWTANDRRANLLPMSRDDRGFLRGVAVPLVGLARTAGETDGRCAGDRPMVRIASGGAAPAEGGVACLPGVPPTSCRPDDHRYRGSLPDDAHSHIVPHHADRHLWALAR